MIKSAKTFTPSAANQEFANSIVSQLDALTLTRQNWEQTAYKKSNEQLYSLLSDCLEVFQAKFVNGSKADQKTLREEVITRLKADGVKAQKNSTTLTLFVRLVFGSDRKRAHGYGYVLNAAISHEVKAAELAQWITSEGGIEQIKRKMVQSDEAKARSEKMKNARETAESLIVEAAVNPLATVGIDGIQANSRNIMLAVGSANGEFNVTYVLNEVSDALYNALLKQAAKQIAAEEAKDDAMKTEADSYNTQAANEEKMRKAA
jgi:hypothetical protein